MKKVLLTVALAVATMVGANAQWYLGGAFGFESNSEKSGIDPKTAFGITPEVGYYISEKVDVGLDVGFVSGKTQADDSFSSFQLAPYARYAFLDLGKFSFIAKGTVFFNSIDGTNYFMKGKGEETEFAAGKGTQFGVRVFPQVAYSVSDKWTLFTNLNFAGLNFVSTSPDGGDSFSQFGLGIDANNLLTTGDIQVGFVFKF